MNLSGRLVDAFVALEETRRFARAAERCHMSPSAFSQLISRLEDQVGTRLFDRDTRNVSLTPEGEVFSQGAHRIALEMKATLDALRDRAQHRVGRVSVAAPPTLSAAWLPERMAKFARLHPGIELRLFDEISDRCLQMIARGDVDFGLNAQPGPEHELQAQLLFQEPSFVICRDDNPLAARKSIGLRDLRHQPFVHTLRTGSVWQHLQPIVQAAEVRDTGLEVNQLGTLGGLVAAGFGISIVPQFALQLCQRPGVAAVVLKAENSSRPIYLVRRRDRSLSAAAVAFHDLLLADALPKSRGQGGRVGR
ncbi:LysR substrate-binding domain-containing protein [Ramlibacter sp. AN1015]|uniref:LysR family transcriptional regulator n=1 Tax=Ramlibacter sp. AN1015 TaxID=3133428 RepID=UPI0030C5C32C